MRAYGFWTAAGLVAGGLIVMGTLGADNGVDVSVVLRVATFAGLVLATWLVIDRLAMMERRLDEYERHRAEEVADREDRELLVAETIRATLKAVGHSLDRPDAQVYKIKG